MDAPTRNGIECAKVVAWLTTKPEGGVIMKITTIGIDLAKTIFSCMVSMRRAK